MAITIKKYKGNKDAAKGIEKMEKQGWTVRDQASRKAVYSLAAGLFTRKQIHTITFER